MAIFALALTKCFNLTMEINYKIQFPGMMKGKTILYVHGFASSGQSGTVVKLREMLPEVRVVAPDLPLHPEEAMALLRDVCSKETPDLIIGTSMGGMYAEMLYGHDRILVNPAFEMGETMYKHGHVGKNTYHSRRLDGVQDFILTKAMVEEYKAVTEQCFSGADGEDAGVQVYGLFGDEDPIVHTRDMFAAHYRNAISFHGEHYMNDKVLLHSLIPVVQWIDDRQDGRVRPIAYISIDALRDARGAQHSSAMKAYRFLLENYTVYVVAPSPTNEPEYIAGVTAWVNDIVNVPAWNHVVFTNRKDLLYGDYLVDPSADLGAADFVGTRIVFGDDTFKTWEEIIEFFGRLGGQ